MIKEFFKLNTDKTKPNNINKKYNLSEIKSYTTNDIFSVVSEQGLKNKEFQIKHCYVWQNIYSRKLITGIPFVKGIIMEDAAWWPLLWLRNPTVTITNLPLYYYIPQINSIMAASKVLRKIDNLVFGIKYIFDIYKSQSKKSQMDVWSGEFKWPFLKYGFGKVSKLRDKKDIKDAKKLFKSLNDMSVFDDPKTKSDKLTKQKILDFIK